MSASTAPVVKVGKRQYELGPTLGVGGFSEVKLGIDKQTGKRVALKITYTNDITNQREMNNQLRSVQKEIKSMKKLNHVNIVRLLGYDLKCSVEGKNAIVMVQELAPKGELFDYLMHTNKFKQPLAIAIFHQLVAALSVLHGAGIAHRDLKPENLLFDNDFNLKLVDFGFAYVYKKGENPRTMMRTELGTKGYMAPEILDHEKYTEAADIFAAGVILFICLAGFPPFQDAQSSDWWFDKLKKKKNRLFWMAHERTAKFSPEAKEIIQMMLAANPAERVNVNGIKETAFYNAPHPDKNGLRTQLSERKATVDLKKQEERASGTISRDTFQEAVTTYIGQMKFGDTLELKNLVHTELRQDFAEVKEAKELESIFTKLIDIKKSLGRLKTLDVNEVDLSKVPGLSKTTDVQQIMETLKVNTEEATLILEQLDTSSIIGRIDDYDPALFDQFQDLDNVELPLFDSFYYKTKSYKTPAGLGLILYSFQKYLTKKEMEEFMAISLDLESAVPTINLTGQLQRTVELPVEVEVEGKIEYELGEATMPVTLALQARVFKDPTSHNNIVTFSNANIHTMAEFKQIENELTTNQGFSLFASLLCADSVLETTGDLFEAETYVAERHEQGDDFILIEEEEN